MNVSFLLGSGFSVPDGMRTVTQLNDVIFNLELENIYIHTDTSLLLFLNGNQKPQGYRHHIDEQFFIAFLNFYKKQSDYLNYEELYDYVTSYLRFKTNSEIIEPFIKRFFEGYDGDIRAKSFDELSRFSRNLTKVISILLQTPKYYEDVSYSDIPRYGGIIGCLRQLINDGNVVNIHTLNHDLLFEHIASKHSDLYEFFTDGFTESGSPYYGEMIVEKEIFKTYKVRLKYFDNNYTKPLRLFKLHGSVDYYIANIANPVDLTRIKRDWGVGEMIREVNNNGKLEYQYMLQNTHPDILSGALSKKLFYDLPHYKEQIEYFKSNLDFSDFLVVIGYGFGDSGINKIIEKYYLTKGKKMFVIDIASPTSDLVKYYDSEVILTSVADLGAENWQKIFDRK